MFYKMITAARDKWYGSSDCTINNVINYIETTNKMRDAQIEAIKTYLYLKIACNNKPLEQLFCQGFFNTTDLNAEEISCKTRDYLENNPSAAALYEYSCLKNDAGKQVSLKLKEQITKTPENIDYAGFFHNVFYKVSYTDYLFSLPMGAGKTFLMAAFIYLDLYFAQNAPKNKAFAHNFIIFAPSGLKSSVIPALKTIQKFDPSWIIPEPSASQLKRKLIFEVLDKSQSSGKSNKTKNPNVQKISNHQPFTDLFGLVAVTNAEKVILDRIQENNGQLTFMEESDDEKDCQANELRNLIGKLPSLSIFIDEVHHAVKDEIKLRAVINKWAKNNTFNSVIGFSGTPYLKEAEKVFVSDDFSVSTSEISNIVYYYPLINGIGNFLKKPVVKISDAADSARIIEAGVKEFFSSYKDTIYDGGLTAKLGIYCGTIEKCEELVYPLVLKAASEYGIKSNQILRFHKGNKQHPQPVDSQIQFETLDSPMSKIRIILLVQIGKEGWDCRSLTGIILSQEGDCPRNMVLQTTCRCLRQVTKNKPETAIIYLNKFNAEKLNSQLMQQQHISLNDFSSADNSQTVLNRYNRTEHLKLPKIDFYQLKVSYNTKIIDEALNTDDEIKALLNIKKESYTIKTTDFTMKSIDTAVDKKDNGNVPASFTAWLFAISKASFGNVTMRQLKLHQELLEQIFDKLTYIKDDVRYFSSLIDRKAIESSIRKAFYKKRGLMTVEELILVKARLLKDENFSSEVVTRKINDFFPTQETIEKIISDDAGKLKLDEKSEKIYQLAVESNYKEIIEDIRSKFTSHPQKDRSFHYLPYKMDSQFEQTFLNEALVLSEIEKYGLEIYYNGDDTLTEFKIKCFKKNNSKWQYIGMYTPDFLIIKRKDEVIHKALIVETKGKIYANDPKFKDKREFTETEFIKQNNDKFGYKRFDYIYLEDTLSKSNSDMIKTVHEKICEFFKEDIV